MWDPSQGYCCFQSCCRKGSWKVNSCWVECEEETTACYWHLSASRNNVPGEKGGQRLTQADWTVQSFTKVPGLYYSSVKYCFLSMIAKQSMDANGNRLILRTSVWVLSVLILPSSRLSEFWVVLFCFYYFNFFLMCMCVLPLYLYAYHMCAWCPRRPKVVRWFSLELECWKWNPGPLAEQQVHLTTLLLTR